MNGLLKRAAELRLFKFFLDNVPQILQQLREAAAGMNELNYQTKLKVMKASVEKLLRNLERIEVKSSGSDLKSNVQKELARWQLLEQRLEGFSKLKESSRIREFKVAVLAFLAEYETSLRDCTATIALDIQTAEATR